MKNQNILVFVRGSPSFLYTIAWWRWLEKKNYCVGMRAFWYCTFAWLRSHLEHWRWWWR